MPDFGINNNGSGFDLDDDNDVNSLLELASHGEEDDDDDNTSFFDENGEYHAKNTESFDNEYSENNVEEKTEDYHIDETINDHHNNQPAFDDEISANTNENTELVEENHPQYVNDGYHRENNQTMYHNEDNDTSSSERDYSNNHLNEDNDSVIYNNRKISVRTQKQEISDARTIIHVLDVYRALPESHKSIIAQFINMEEELDPDDEASVVISSIRADDMHYKTMSNLRSAIEEKDRIERVFFILDLPEYEIRKLGDLISSFSDDPIENDKSSMRYAKSLEQKVNELDSNIIQYVVEAQEVLEATRANDD